MKLLQILAVLRAGGAVAYPSAWRKGAVAANALTALLVALMALARGCGYDFPIDDAGLASVAAGFLAIANGIVHISTDSALGLSSGGRGVAPPGDSGADR